MLWYFIRFKQTTLFLYLLNNLPLHPNISMHILHTVLYTFFNVLIRRICLTIKSFLVDNHFLYSHDLNVRFRGDIVRRN